LRSLPRRDELSNTNIENIPLKLIHLGHQLFVIYAVLERLQVLGSFAEEDIGLSEQRDTKLHVLPEI
jgi:hypothetical protein